LSFYINFDKNFQKTEVKKIRELPKQNYTVVKRIRKYVAENADGLPLIKDFCLKNDWFYEDLIKLGDKDERVRQALKMIEYKAEVNLQQHAILGKFNKQMAAFLITRMDNDGSHIGHQLRLLDKLLAEDEAQAAAFCWELQDDE
jgi:hypothetical protein